MKSLYIISLCFLLALRTAMAGANDITVYGQIRGATSGVVSLNILHDFINFKEVALQSEIDSAGHFSINVHLQQPCLAELHCNNEMVRLFLQPNDNISIYSDYVKFSRNIVFLGKGAAENNYLALVYNQLDPMSEMRLIPSKVRELKPALYADAVLSKKNLQQAFFQQYIKQTKVNAAFEKLINYEIEYTAAYEMLVYPEMHTYLSGNDTLPSNYYSFLKNIKLEEPEALITYCYANFLEEYARYLFREKNAGIGGTFKYAYLAMYDLIKSSFANPRVRDFVLAQNLVNALENSEVSIVEPQYNDYKELKPTAEYLALLDLNFNKYKALSKGHKAPSFSLIDTYGKAVSLNDFIGKVVYIDFWASWCKPCLKEAQFANELKLKMANKDVVFLYISLDENEQNWRNSIRTRNIQGIHLNSRGIASEVAINYNIQSVPSFFLIDKQGNMYDSQAKRPSNRALQEEMEMLLQR